MGNTDAVPESRSENVVQERSYAFAVRVVRMYQHLSAEKKEFVLSKQVLRSETSYWLRLLKDSGYIDEAAFDYIHADCEERLKLPLYHR